MVSSTNENSQGIVTLRVSIIFVFRQVTPLFFVGQPGPAWPSEMSSEKTTSKAPNRQRLDPLEMNGSDGWQEAHDHTDVTTDNEPDRLAALT